MKQSANARRFVMLTVASLMLGGCGNHVDGADSPTADVSVRSDGGQILVIFDRSAPFTIDIPALAARLTARGGSKAFALEPAVGQSVESHWMSSRIGGTDQVTLRLGTVATPPGSYDLDLSLEHAVLDGLDRVVPVDYHWGALPLVSVGAVPDDELFRVRRFWLGTIAYSTTPPGTYLTCTVPESDSEYLVDDPSPRVVAVERSYDIDAPLVANGEERGDPRGVLALPPLRLTFEISRRATIQRYGSEKVFVPIEPDARRKCARLTMDFSTSWHVYRMLRHTPATVRVGPTRDDRKALVDGRPLIGMTHEQVAAIWGYPPELLDASTMERLSEWTWPNARDVRYAHFEGDRADRFMRK